MGMLPTKEQLMTMPLKTLADRLHGCFPGSDTWNVVWPVYETKRHRSEIRRTWICFGISTAIALAALTRTFFPAPQPHSEVVKPAAVKNDPLEPHSEVVKPAAVKNDPLGLFNPNPQLDACFKSVNPSDPLGIRSNDPLEDAKRRECIAQFAK
jgi:hypothetical protein